MHIVSSGDDGDDFLERVGARVRSARAQRGMTRKLLAKASAVSERHLAELEAGRGNVSIRLLRQVAAALDVPLAVFVDAGAEPDVALGLVQGLLGRLAPEQRADAYEVLLRHFGMPDRDLRRERIALVGLRGAGKSTLGRGLAARRGVPFIELDARIEENSGLSLASIFDLYGQAGFRRFERAALERVLESEGAFVLATSGSIVADPQTYGALLAMCRTVWLKATPLDHMARVVAQGDMRPMADNGEAMADLEAILRHRAELYGRADAVVETSGRSEAAALDGLEAAVAALKA